jgi:type II secretion system protein H
VEHTRPTPAARAARTLRAGFSMVEMLAVIVILGLIATIVTVSWRAVLPHEELHSAVRGLAAALQSVRSEAISRNGEYRIQYDLEANRYRTVTPFKAGGGLAAKEEERMPLAWTTFPKSVKFQRVMIDGIEYSHGIVFVRFDPLGAASGHTITLVQEPDKNQYTIDVQGLTGLIDYHEGLFVREPPQDTDFN